MALPTRASFIAKLLRAEVHFEKSGDAWTLKLNGPICVAGAIALAFWLF
jgi:hypothetical protein